MRHIFTKDLAKIFTLIIGKLEFEQLEKIEISSDLYRYISTENWESFEKNEVDVGSLFDDLDSLKLLIADPKRPVTYVDFDRAASVLRAISQIKNPL
jgi:hypothetical protein